MTDQPEKKSETEDVDADFEGHRLSGPEKSSKLGDITDVKAANEDDERRTSRVTGSRGPEKLGVEGCRSSPDVKA